MGICFNTNEHEYLIKAIVSSYCPNDEFKEKVKREKKIDLGHALSLYFKNGRIKREEFEIIDKKIKKSL